MDRLVGLWAELLEVDGVDAGSDFFELGGRSLTAVRLAYVIEEEFGVELPVAMALVNIAGIQLRPFMMSLRFSGSSLKLFSKLISRPRKLWSRPKSWRARAVIRR